MTVSKLNPWNWFKKEHEQEKTLPVRQSDRKTSMVSPLDQFHTEFDRMVESMFSGFGIRPHGRMFNMPTSGLDSAALKPNIDVYGTTKEYVIEAELPGVEEKDLSIELLDDVLIISAERKHSETTDEKGYYRVERSYGSFRRTLDIPHDADRDKIRAKLNNGVLCITMPRTGIATASSRNIPIDNSPSA